MLTVAAGLSSNLHNVINFAKHVLKSLEKVSNEKFAGGR